MILMFLGSLIFTGQIVRNIRSIEGSIGRLKDGDLRETGIVKSRDELARLNGNLGHVSGLSEGDHRPDQGTSLTRTSASGTFSSVR